MATEQDEQTEIQRRLFLVRVEEDLIGMEPARIDFRLEGEDRVHSIDEVLCEIDLRAPLGHVRDTLINVTNKAPLEVIPIDLDPGDRDRSEWRKKAARVAEEIRDLVHERWPDIDDRIAEKHARLAALTRLPDRAIIVQVAEVLRDEGERRMLVLFLVPRMAPVMPGHHLQVLASFAAHYCDAFTLQGLEHLVIDRDIDFRFMPCRMASDDLVATWRLYLEGLGMLPRTG